MGLHEVQIDWGGDTRRSLLVAATLGHPQLILSCDIGMFVFPKGWTVMHWKRIFRLRGDASWARKSNRSICWAAIPSSRKRNEWKLGRHCYILLSTNMFLSVPLFFSFFFLTENRYISRQIDRIDFILHMPLSQAKYPRIFAWSAKHFTLLQLTPSQRCSWE